MSRGFVVCEEFLAPSEAAALWSYAMSRESEFVASEVTGADEHGRRDDGFRRSRVLYDLGDAHALLADRVMRRLPDVIERLGIASFDVTGIELQATATNDGEWFKPHRDSGDGHVSTRELTFVYYGHREPLGFEGGELRMFGPFVDPEAPGADFEAVSPRANSIIFFPSHYLHEVAYVSCPSLRFADSRLTYNGWLHR